MGHLIADVRELVRQVAQLDGLEIVDADVPIDYGRFHALIFELLEPSSVAKKSLGPGRWSLWGPERVNRTVFGANLGLISTWGARLSAQEREDRLEDALRIACGQEPPELNAMMLSRTKLLAKSTAGWDAAEYAQELRLISQLRAAPQLEEAGRVLLQLRGKDATRWLLALEVVQSYGELDPWRICHSNVRRVLQWSSVPSVELDNSQPPSKLVDRLSKMGLLDEDEGEAALHFNFSYALTALGQELLEELLEETPFTVMAQAIINDNRSSVLNTAQTSQAEATQRHARLVAHEVRNALLPVDAGLKKVWKALAGTSYLSTLEKPRQRIEAGIRKLFLFADQSVRLTPAAADEIETFPVIDVVHEARASLSDEHSGRFVVEAVPGNAEPRVRGHRGRFVVALANLMRNAIQIGDVSVQLRVIVDNQNKTFMRILVEDSGPGVLEARRQTIFEPGVSFRPDGSGEGLALVHEIVESEMRGTIICDASDLGGARFTIELPSHKDVS